MFTNNALADALLVPNHYLTIQEAIHASNPGDTVVVASGVYRLHSGNIAIAKESITLRSSYGAEKTIIEGRGNIPVITFGENSKSVIEGFTITSVDDVETKAVKGGGIYCAPLSSPTISNNIITGNAAVFGGGIYCDDSSTPTIRNNVISKNNALVSGGGIFAYNASPRIANNRIMWNQASNAGGGFSTYKGSPRIINSIIWKNKAISGGGISCDKSSCSIINDTITENTSKYGGGVFFDAGSVRIINNILWKNEDDLYSGLFGTASRPNHSNIGDGDFLGINGNISDDPQFMDPENGDFRLKKERSHLVWPPTSVTMYSPCIDGGNPDPIYNDPDGSRNDMGAYGGPGANAWAFPADFKSPTLQEIAEPR
jgi:parallel beta-helix repeat protein